jgi:hypothetical protein
VIGEMAGSHGVKRPGGSALNAGQTGGLRAAEYIVNAYGCELAGYSEQLDLAEQQLTEFIDRIGNYGGSSGLAPAEVIEQIQSRMTASAGHIREMKDAQRALKEAVELHKEIQSQGFKLRNAGDIVTAIQAEHLALTSVAYLKAIVALLADGSGSRGSHLVLADDGIEIHPDVVNKATGEPLKFKPENESLRSSVLQVQYDEDSADLFQCRTVKRRQAPTERKAFEPAWQDYREDKIYQS